MALENDVVLIFFEEQPMGFARIESITADHKPNWYHVKLLLLEIPLRVVTWILRDIYIDGEEFTMNGNKMRLEKVICPEDPESFVSQEKKTTSTPENDSAKVISFKDLKKE